jgi:hypothetical protein
MVGGLIDDTMEVKFDRPDPSIVTDYGNGLNATQKQGFYHLSQGSEIVPWIVLTAVDPCHLRRERDDAPRPARRAARTGRRH